jgi:hypothetical protein
MKLIAKIEKEFKSETGKELNEATITRVDYSTA